MEATHFIEVFKSKGSRKLLTGNEHPISFLDVALRTTAQSKDLKTIAVWMIKKKENGTT